MVRCKGIIPACASQDIEIADKNCMTADQIEIDAATNGDGVYAVCVLTVKPYVAP